MIFQAIYSELNENVLKTFPESKITFWLGPFISWKFTFNEYFQDNVLRIKYNINIINNNIFLKQY